MYSKKVINNGLFTHRYVNSEIDPENSSTKWVDDKLLKCLENDIHEWITDERLKSVGNSESEWHGISCTCVIAICRCPFRYTRNYSHTFDMNTIICKKCNNLQINFYHKGECIVTFIVTTKDVEFQFHPTALLCNDLVLTLEEKKERLIITDRDNKVHNPEEYDGNIYDAKNLLFNFDRITRQKTEEKLIKYDDYQLLPTSALQHVLDKINRNKAIVIDI